MLGVIFAIAGNLLNACGLISQKYGINRANNLVWFMGLGVNALGEIMNTVAYVYAPSFIVAPLGAVTVGITPLMAKYALGETYHTRHKVGVGFILSGCTLLTIVGATNSFEYSLEEILTKIHSRKSLIYIGCSVFLGLCIHNLLRSPNERYNKVHMMLLLLLCSLYGQYMILCIKVISTLIMTTFDIRYFVAFMCIGCVCLASVVYLQQQALSKYNAIHVIPVFYMLFTSCVILCTAIVLDELYMFVNKDNIAQVVVGIFCSVLGVYILPVSAETEESVAPIDNFSML